MSKKFIIVAVHIRVVEVPTLNCQPLTPLNSDGDAGESNVVLEGEESSEVRVFTG